MSFQTEEEKSHLFCWLEYKINLYYLIGPVKMELLSRDPDILQVYNVLGEDAMEDVKARTAGSLYRDHGYKGVYDEVKGLPKYSMAAYVPETLPQIIAMYKNMKLMTRLDPYQLNVESLKMTRYTFNGYFDTHSDSVSAVLEIFEILIWHYIALKNFI